MMSLREVERLHDSLPERVALLINQKLIEYYRVLRTGDVGKRDAFLAALKRPAFLRRIGHSGRRYLNSGIDDVNATVRAPSARRAAGTRKRSRLSA